MSRTAVGSSPVMTVRAAARPRRNAGQYRTSFTVFKKLRHFLSEIRSPYYPCIIAHFRPVATMSKRSKKPNSHEIPAPAVPPARRVATRRAIAERKLRIVERLTSGLSVAHIAHVEQLTI